MNTLWLLLCWDVVYTFWTNERIAFDCLRQLWTRRVRRIDWIFKDGWSGSSSIYVYWFVIMFGRFIYRSKDYRPKTLIMDRVWTGFISIWARSWPCPKMLDRSLLKVEGHECPSNKLDKSHCHAKENFSCQVAMDLRITGCYNIIFTLVVWLLY